MFDASSKWSNIAFRKKKGWKRIVDSDKETNKKTGRKVQNNLQILRVVALLLLTGVIICAALKLKENPELASPENIAGLVSPNLVIATMEFVLLYILKGISFIFPSTALNIASGMIFDFPFSILISCLGIFCEFTFLYLLGRILGKESVDQFKEKYRMINRIESFQTKNSFLSSFLIRIIGLVSYDAGSIYLGATGVGYCSFIAGSMLGALLNIVIDNLFGKYVFNPLNWQLWAVVGIRAAIIATVAGIKNMAEKHGKQNC